METLVGHRDPPADANSKEGFELTREMEKLSSVEIHWDFPHKYDVDLAGDGPPEIKGGLLPERWMSNWYKQTVTKRKGLKFSYRPVYAGNLGRDGTSDKKDPQFAQPLDETYQFSDLSSLK